MQSGVPTANQMLDVRVLLPGRCLATGTAAPVIQSMESPAGVYMGGGNKKWSLDTQRGGKWPRMDSISHTAEQKYEW